MEKKKYIYIKKGIFKLNEKHNNFKIQYKNVCN